MGLCVVLAVSALAALVLVSLSANGKLPSLYASRYALALQTHTNIARLAAILGPYAFGCVCILPDPLNAEIGLIRRPIMGKYNESEVYHLYTAGNTFPPRKWKLPPIR